MCGARAPNNVSSKAALMYRAAFFLRLLARFIQGAARMSDDHGPLHDIHYDEILSLPKPREVRRAPESMRHNTYVRDKERTAKTAAEQRELMDIQVDKSIK
jgi:hypothetical protein